MGNYPAHHAVGGLFAFALLASCPLWPSSMPHAVPPSRTAVIEHAAVTEFQAGAPLEFRARVSAPAAWLSVFYRLPGLDFFQARPMDKAPDGGYLLVLDTSMLPSQEFDYYIAAGVESGIAFFPEEGEGRPLHVAAKGESVPVEIPADIPTPAEETAPAAPAVPFPVQVTGSGQAVLAERAPLPGAEKYPVSGNVRFFFMPPQTGSFGLNFDSNFTYTNAPLEGFKPLDLSNVNAALVLSSHTLRAGDITVQESEYSMQGLGRRGLEYAFDNQKAYLHLFTVHAQQPRGFSGFGVPRSELALFGGALGFRILGEALFFKAIYLAGRDNPSLGAAVAVPEDIPGSTGRKGGVLALTEETRLWSGQFGFKAEFAHSSCDKDLEDSEGPVGASAFTLGSNVAAGALTASVVFRRVGRDFNSIGLQSQANNRSGLEAMAGLAAGPFSLSGTLVSQRDNVEDDPESPTTSSLDGSLNLSLVLSAKAQLSFGYRLGRQGTTPGLEETAIQDSATDELTGSFNLTLGPSTFTLSVVSSRLSSEVNPETGTSTLSLSLGGSHGGERLIFSSTLGVTTGRNAATGVRSDSISAMAVAEFFLLPQAFSLGLTGSVSRSEQPPAASSMNLDLQGGLNLYIGRVIKLGSFLVSFKGSYGSVESAGTSTANWKVFGQCDVSF